MNKIAVVKELVRIAKSLTAEEPVTYEKFVDELDMWITDIEEHENDISGFFPYFPKDSPEHKNLQKMTDALVYLVDDGPKALKKLAKSRNTNGEWELEKRD